MRFLVDNNLSPRLASELTASGHDAKHIRDFGLSAASDEIVLQQADAEDRVLISADTDFGTLLAYSGAATPSVVLVRRICGRRVEGILAILLANLDVIAQDLQSGAIVAIGDDWLRIRSLPILPGTRRIGPQ
jgi:predicted nuclease of predicted toxin-antitoxin system